MKGLPPLCAVSAVGLEPIQRSGCSFIPLGASLRRRAHRKERELPVCWCWLRNALPITRTAGAHGKLSPGLDPSKPRIMMFGTPTPLAPHGRSAVLCTRTPDPNFVPHISICPYRTFCQVSCEGSAWQKHRKNLGFAARRSAFPPSLGRLGSHPQTHRSYGATPSFLRRLNSTTFPDDEEFYA